MNQETRNILENADDPIGCEFPNNDWVAFPWAQYQAEVKAIKEELHKSLGLISTLEGSVQDSSHHESLYVNIPNVINAEIVSEYQFTIRFSNFAKLYTIEGAKSSLENNCIGKVKSIVNAYNWNFVESGELQEPYDGANEMLAGEPSITWYNRFFYYL